MGTERIYDAGGGVVSTVQTDELQGKVVYAQYQDTTAIIENNKNLQKENDGYNPAKDIRRVANIPVVVLMNWLKEDGIDAGLYMRNSRHYAAWLRKKLYDPDNSAMLTAPHMKAPRRASNTGIDGILAEGRKVGA